MKTSILVYLMLIFASCTTQKETPTIKQEVEDIWMGFYPQTLGYEIFTLANKIQKVKDTLRFKHECICEHKEVWQGFVTSKEIIIFIEVQKRPKDPVIYFEYQIRKNNTGQFEYQISGKKDGFPIHNHKQILVMVVEGLGKYIFRFDSYLKPLWEEVAMKAIELRDT